MGGKTPQVQQTRWKKGENNSGNTDKKIQEKHLRIFGFIN